MSYTHLVRLCTGGASSVETGGELTDIWLLIDALRDGPGEAGAPYIIPVVKY